MGYWLSGVDEAGYGPTLGPLVVGLATVRSDEKITPGSPWKKLAPVVVHRYRKRAGRKGHLSHSIAVADSKLLHRPSTGDLSPLEEGVLSFIAAELGDAPPASFRELVHHVTGGQSAYLDRYPWYQDRDIPLPVSLPRLELLGSIRRLRRRLDGAKLEIGEVRALPVEVTEFNHALARNDLNKSEVNAWLVGRFLSFLWKNDRPAGDVWVDRLGGRQRYGPFLYPLFPEARLQIVEQGDTSQEYRIETTNPAAPRSLGIHFQKDGEAKCFPTALASMTAKYLRELHMRLFNEWWHEQSPGLRRTAGYVQDARRFLEEIEPLRLRLGIDRALLVRQR